MNLLVSNLLIQVLAVVFPIIIYEAVIKQKQIRGQYHSISFGLLCLSSIFICISYPVSFSPGTIMDLRTVPWLMSFLYGSFKIGYFITGLMFLYRYSLGGNGIYIVLIAYPITIFFLHSFSLRTYIEWSYQKKLYTAVGFAFSNSLLIVISIHFIFKYPIDQDRMLFYAGFMFTHALSMWLVVYIKEFFEENKRLHTEIERSEKMNVVGQLAAAVAHEVRNPMTVVSGFMQLMSKADDIPPRYQDHIKIMMVELDRAETVINDYLSLAKPQAEDHVLVDVNKQLHYVKNTMSSFALLRNVEIQFEENKDSHLTFMGTTAKLNQVLVNIIKNAIEACSSSCVIKIAAYRGCSKSS
jgi:two-component system sporulation sensor kinase B